VNSWYAAVLFGGPFDGRVIHLRHISEELRIPHVDDARMPTYRILAYRVRYGPMRLPSIDDYGRSVYDYVDNT
jgi:hypothetical protein